jgi:hypothetical protein
MQAVGVLCQGTNAKDGNAQTRLGFLVKLPMKLLENSLQQLRICHLRKLGYITSQLLSDEVLIQCHESNIPKARINAYDSAPLGTPPN